MMPKNLWKPVLAVFLPLLIYSICLTVSELLYYKFHCYGAKNYEDIYKAFSILVSIVVYFCMFKFQKYYFAGYLIYLAFIYLFFKFYTYWYLGVFHGNFV